VFIIVFHYALSVFSCQKSPHLDESKIDVVQLNSHWVSSAVVNHYGDDDARRGRETPKLLAREPWTSIRMSGQPRGNEQPQPSHV
jgi:hypothetical protein